MENIINKAKTYLKANPVLWIGFLVFFCLLTIAYYIKTAPEKIDSSAKKELIQLDKKIDSLKRDQASYDSLIRLKDEEIKDLYEKIGNIKQKEVITREYYIDRLSNVKKYNSTQVDSFLKNRYNY